MVDLEALAKRARRAAEWGWLRHASRVAAVVVPFAAVAMLTSPHRAAVFAIGLALLAVTIALGWHNADGGRAARFGLRWRFSRPWRQAPRWLGCRRGRT